MLTPELHISTDFITNDHIGSETLRAYCAELKKTKVVIFALCVQGRLKAMINLVHYNIGYSFGKFYSNIKNIGRYTDACHSIFATIRSRNQFR